MADVSQYDPIFQAAGDEWNVDPRLLKAMAMQESQGDPRAVSKKGAQGLMQIIPETQRGLGVTDPNDPVQSIYGAAKYMNEALDAEGTPERALLYYHGGPKWRDKYGPESVGYVPAVTAHYQQLAKSDTSTAPAAPPPPSASQGPLILGDSLASKQGLGGTGIVGAQPKAVLDSISGLPDDQVRGRDVVISSGASNNPAQASLVYEQVKSLKDRGANTVTVVGVGDHPKLAGVNDTLAIATGRASGQFVPVPTDQLSGDRIHPTAQGYRSLLAAVTPKTATDASPAPASPPAPTTGPGNAMASNDLPSWLPPAPNASGGASATPAAKDGKPDDLPSWLPPAPQGTTAAPPATPGVDDYGLPTDRPDLDITPSPAVTGALGRIGRAAAEGWQGAPAIPYPSDPSSGLGVNQPLAAIGNALLGGGSAVLRGLQQTAVEATPDIHLPSLPPGVSIPLGGNRSISGELTPGSLGQEVAALPEAFPFGFNALRPPGRPPIPEAPPSPRFVQEFYGEGTPANPLAAAPPAERPAFVPPGVNAPPRPVEPPAFVPPGEAPRTPTPSEAPITSIPEPGTPAAPPLSAEDQRWVAGAQARINEINQANRAAGVPGSLSAAATPEELARLTPQQMKAYRRQAELGEILAPPERGMDRSIYVEGTEPTRAVYSGDPAISQQERLHRERDPNSFDARDQKNTKAVVNDYESMMGTDPQVSDLKDAKAAAAEKDGAAYIKAARPLDFQPALKWLDEKLADPRIQERPEVRDVLTKLRESLFDERGQLKTDPRAGWGMHDNMINRLDKAGDRTSAERYAITQLKQYKDIIDGVNNTASDGAFQTFLDNQSHYAQQINAMQELQKFRPRFANAKGEINATAFHKFVTDLAIRRGRPGMDPAMDISDETMRGLINIDKHLKRETNIDLGKARGSNTNLLFTLAQAAGLGAAHLGVAAMTHGNPTANLFVQGALNQAGRMTGNVLLRRAVRRGLAPPPGGYDYNPLQQGPP